MYEFCESCGEITKSAIAVGDWARVRKEYMFRSGEEGEILHFDDKGCGLDFYTSRVPSPDYISQEFWEWGELEFCDCPAAAKAPTP